MAKEARKGKDIDILLLTREGNKSPPLFKFINNLKYIFMSHHGSNDFDLNNYGSEDLKSKLFGDAKPISREQMAEIMNAQAKAQKLGATGSFPDGTIGSGDEGEIKLGVTSYQNQVVLNFGKPIVWIGFTKQEAKEIGEVLIKRALDL